jgi:bacterioferritin-associated ferredoxin
MIVCHCHQLTDRDLVAEPSQGGLSCAFRVAGTACGGCRPVVEALLDKALAELAPCACSSEARRKAPATANSHATPSVA